MKFTEQIAKQLRELYFGANWTAVSIKDSLADVSWQQATTTVGSFHSIATLVFHINYYVAATIPVLQGGALEAKDELSFDCPPITSEEDWQQLLNSTWAKTEQLACLIESLPDERLGETFVEEKYGTYARCLLGPIEHGYYHLGQIAILKKMLQQS